MEWNGTERDQETAYGRDSECGYTGHSLLKESSGLLSYLVARL